MDVIVGTVGHIDHGKTALVKALTGMDADRLPEEKRRGITVDLGFADLTVDDIHFGFVDVPGHERFVKNMLAGASGIDLVLFVLAADEGVMPQTREHFDICRLLGLSSGVIALTKSDLVDEETLELARLDVAELVEDSFLGDAPVVSVSARTGAGIAELKQTLVDLAHKRSERQQRYVTRLPIDRSFSMKGFGAVVTGTLASGQIGNADVLELLPEGRAIRVRGLQTHGHSAEAVHAGQRVAVNLGGVAHTEVTRGMTLTEPGVLKATQAVDAYVEVLPHAPRPLRSRQRVRVHLGTGEILARVQVLNDVGEIAPSESGHAQLRLEEPTVAVMGERFIIRSYSPQVTIAGGEVVDPLATRHRRRDLTAVTKVLDELRLRTDERKIALLVEASGTAGATLDTIRSRTGFANVVLSTAIAGATSGGGIVQCDTHYVSSLVFDSLRTTTQNAVAHFHKRDPLAKGMPIGELRSGALAGAAETVARYVLRSLEPEIVSEHESVRLASHRAEMSPAETSFTKMLKDLYRTAGIEVPKTADAVASALQGSTLGAPQANKLLHLMYSSGQLVRVSDDLCFDPDVIKRLVERIRDHAATTSDRVIDVSVFKDLAGVSRKYAIPLLEYLDREKVTARAGANRVVL